MSLLLKQGILLSAFKDFWRGHKQCQFYPKQGTFLRLFSSAFGGSPSLPHWGDVVYGWPLKEKTEIFEAKDIAWNLKYLTFDGARNLRAKKSLFSFLSLGRLRITKILALFNYKLANGF